MQSEIESELNKINLYFLNKPPKDERIGLYIGASGKCLFMAQNFLATDDDTYLNTVNELLEYVLEEIQSSNAINPTFSAGLAGWGWLVQYLSEKKVIDPDVDELLSYFDGFLYHHMNEFLARNDNDLLNGALGIGRYFIVRKKYDYVEKLIEYLIDNQIDNEIEIKWKRMNWHNEGHFYYDCGLAHGISGIIHFLATCYKINLKKNACERLLQGAIRFLVNNIQNVEATGCFFPNVFDVDAYDNLKEPHFSRLAWCYGDLSIWYILYKVSILIKDVHLEKKSINGLLAVTKRKSFDETLVVDPGFCHGSSGIAYIFNKLWYETAIVDFKEAGEHWLRVTLNYGNKQPGVEGYKFLLGNFEDRKFTHSDDLLEGLCGVGIAYLSYLYPNLLDWDDCVLLNL